MSTDNRTVINDCESNTGWNGDDTATPNSDAGQFYEGSNSLSTQLSNADEHMYTTEDSVGSSTFNLDWSDATLYLLVKDNLQQSYANGGVQFVIGDGTNRTGYDVGGNDAVGLPLPTYFNCYKLDVSVKVASPGSNFTDYAGSEGSLDQTQITEIGYGTIHLAKAVGSVDNVFMDCFRYIANGSYALTINGGTSGTPETMADVAGDDVSNGWGLISNRLGNLYYFFGPTEWGEASASADHYFEAIDEQWFWIGDNGGGHALGAGNFPFRLISNATDTGSFKLTRVVVVNTGTRAELDMSDTNFETIEIEGCSFSGLGTVEAPSVGGTSRFCMDTVFTDCDVVTHHGCDMSGSSVLNSAVAADEGALFYDETVDPDGEMDNMSFSKGANAHHAIRFGTNVPASMTLRGCDFSGFGSSDDANDSVFRFDDTGGNITLNLVGCSHDGSGFTVDDAAGVTVTVNIDPVTLTIKVTDNTGANLQNARVYAKAADGSGDFPFEESVTISRSGTTATVSHTAHGLKTGEKVKIQGITDKTEDNNGVHTISVLGNDSYTYQTSDQGSTSYNGSIIATGVLIEGLTDSNGEISMQRTLTSDQLFNGFVRKSTSSPRFKSFALSGTVDSAGGANVNVRMVLDE